MTTAVKVFYISIILPFIAAEVNIRKCKLTHSGIEYRGNVFITKSKSLCRQWDSIEVNTYIAYIFNYILVIFVTQKKNK